MRVNSHSLVRAIVSWDKRRSNLILYVDPTYEFVQQSRIKGKAKPDGEYIRGLDLSAVKLMPICVARLPL
jgi:hypothetical protein